MLAAARTLGGHSPALKDPSASLLPPLTEIRKVAADIAVAVGIEAQKNGVAPLTSEDELRQRVLKTQWTPAYSPWFEELEHYGERDIPNRPARCRRQSIHSTLGHRHRQESRNGDHRRRPDPFRDRPHGGQFKDILGPERDQHILTIPARSRFTCACYGQLLWVVRIVLLLCVAFHITAAVQLSRMSWSARPIGYKVKRNIETTWAARMMRWGGVLLVAFVIFHLLHLTGGLVGFRPGQFKDLAVYQNVLAAFSIWPVAIFYVVAMGALCLHLNHGIWSMLQTLGWNTARNETTLKAVSRLIAIVVFLGFSSVPVAVMAGWLH